MSKTILKKQGGFTIVELLIVIVVIAILAAVTIVAYTGIQARAKEAKTVSMVRSTANALEAYKAVNSQYPKVSSTPMSTITGACLGKGYPNDTCATLQFTGDCSTYGVTDYSEMRAFTTSNDLDAQLLQFLKTNLPALTFDPFTILIPLDNGSTTCKLKQSIYGMYYSIACEVYIDGNGMPISSNDAYNECYDATAYQVTYQLPKKNSSCGVSGAKDMTSLYETAYAQQINGTACVLIGGKTLPYQP